LLLIIPIQWGIKYLFKISISYRNIFKNNVIGMPIAYRQCKWRNKKVINRKNKKGGSKMKRILRVLLAAVLGVFLVVGTGSATSVIIDFGHYGLGGTIAWDTRTNEVVGTDIPISGLTVDGVPGYSRTYDVTDGSTTSTGLGKLNFDTGANTISIEGAVPELSLGFQTLLIGTFSSYDILSPYGKILAFSAAGPDEKSDFLLIALGLDPQNIDFAYFGWSTTAISTDFVNTQIPEPASMLLLGLGLLGIGLVSRKKTN
jgi:hypothetical protein